MLENAQASEATTKKDKEDAQARVEVLEAQVQVLKELRAADVVAIKDKDIDDAWYRMWSTNPKVLDLEFLGEANETILARWNIRLEQEELETTMAEGAVEDDEDQGEVVSSPSLKIPRTSAMLAAEIDALDRELDEAAEAARSPFNEPTVLPSEEIIPTAQPSSQVPSNHL